MKKHYHIVLPISSEGNDNKMNQIITKLQDESIAGNIEAIKTLQKLQATNRFNALVNNMDEDEFTD